MNATAPGPGFPAPREDAPLVVFDFDHTLYDGDSGSHLFRWLIERAWWRRALALLAAPVAGPMVAFLPTRRAGISAFVWIGTVGLHRRRDLDALIDRYVATHADAIRARLLPIALDVLRHHRERGDRVVVATGAPRHCHHAMKMAMLRDAGFTQPVDVAYSDSSADLPLLQAARRPVVVNPKPRRVAMFRRVLPPGTPILNWGCPGRGGDAVASAA